MLHILMCILKIIGWILLAILGIVVLLVCIFLFEPVRYKLIARIEEDSKNLFLDLKINWLFHLIRGQVLYDKGELSWHVKAAWKEFPDEEEKQEESTLEKEEPVVKKKVEENSSVSKTGVEQPSVLAKKQEQAHFREENRGVDKSFERKNEKQKRQKFSEKLSGIVEKIKYTFQKIYATIKSLKKKKDYIELFLKNETHKQAWHLLIDQIRKLIYRIRPKKISGNVEFGTEDPALTGQILAFISMIYPFTGEDIEIYPNFDEKKLNGDVFISGRVRSITFVRMAIRLIISKEARLTFKHIRKLINKI